MSTDWRDTLNNEQRRAAEYDQGPLLVLAGPGTGKTRVLISRIARLIEEGAAPDSILALAFNVKAAQELRDRLAEAIGPAVASHVQARTIHGFGNDLIRRFGDWIGIRRDRVIMDSAQITGLLRKLVYQHHLYEHLAAAGREQGIQHARNFITHCRQNAKAPQQALDYAKAWRARIGSHAIESDAGIAEMQNCLEFTEGARAYALFDAECLQQGLSTFDECLTLPLRIFSERPAAAAIIRDQSRHILVDEFQDQNRAQIELLRHLAPPASNPDIFAVGDDDQAIYQFRGADTRAFTHFAEIWKNHERITLEINYRSAPDIITAANAVIAPVATRFDPDKKAIPPAGRPQTPDGVEGVIIHDDSHSGAAVAAMILLERRANPSRPLSSFGVIARGHKELHTAAAEFERLGLPASIRETPDINAEDGARDLFAWIDLLTTPAGAAAAAHTRRLLVRPPFFIPTAQVHAWHLQYESDRSRRAPGEALTFIDWLTPSRLSEPSLDRFLTTFDDLKAVNLQHRAERVILEIIRAADIARAEELAPRDRARRISTLVTILRFARSRQASFDEPGDLAAFARYYRDLDERDRNLSFSTEESLEAAESGDDSGRDAVQLMTAHVAKGLEFDTVFLLKCRPGGFPPRKREAEFICPPDFTGREPENEADVERRIFYVACTRARARLVLIAKAKGDSSKVTDYYNQLTKGTPALTVTTHALSSLLEQAGLRAVDDLPLDADAADHRRVAMIRAEMHAVRQHAYTALHDAASSDSPALISAQQRLTDAAAALHALERLRAGETSINNLPSPYAERLQRLMDRIAQQEAPAPPRNLTSPLRLTYTRLSAYIDCPACFYLQYVLGLPQESSPTLNFGQMVHVVLERFYRELRDAEAAGDPLPDVARLADICDKTFRELWPANERLDHAVIDQALAQVAGALTHLHEPASNVIEIEHSIPFRYPDPDEPGLFHEFNAKIDRIDTAHDGSFRLIDYKSGSPTIARRTPPPTDLQLSIYAMALAAMVNGPDADLTKPPPGHAEYWLLAESARGRIALQQLDLNAARTRIDNAIRGIRAGLYAPKRKCEKRCEALLAALTP